VCDGEQARARSRYGGHKSGEKLIDKEQAARYRQG
jgi:hypothetical protein